MRILVRFALSTGAAALFAACGVPQSPIGTPGAMQRPSYSVSSPYQMLYVFRGRRHGDGANPDAGLINVNGTLYGTTSEGGTNRYGTVFSVTTNGSEKVLHNFAGVSDGEYPDAGLINVNGTLYGTAPFGGANYGGTIYSIATSGMFKVLYSFAGGSDGAGPQGNLTNMNGTLYGATSGGGTNGYGTVFSLTTNGTEKVLYSFSGGSDGRGPNGGLINIDGLLYGTTYIGNGSGCFGFGCGTVYSVTTTGRVNVLHKFGHGSDGANPEVGLTNVKGTLYGTTTFGGTNGGGTIFTVTTTGKEKVRYDFGPISGSDGQAPRSSLLDVKGTLYGTTVRGGAADFGTIYSFTTIGKEKVLYSFAGGSDGGLPEAGLINVNGTLYGTTDSAGGYGCRHHAGCGTVFAFAL